MTEVLPTPQFQHYSLLARWLRRPLLGENGLRLSLT